MNDVEIIRTLSGTKGDAKRELLLSLCDYRTAAADDFWRAKLRHPLNGYLPYFCFSRSDVVSDYAADLLEHVVNRLVIIKNRFSPELTEEAWYALNLAAFKQSSRMLEVLQKIGNYAEILRPMRIDMRTLLSSETLPPFLRRQANLAFAHGCETNFLRLVNDLLICTYVRSNGACHDAINALASAFPEAFGYAGFFAAFVTDPDAAYTAYASPTRLEHVLATLRYLEYSDTSGICHLYCPVWFYGARNRIWHKKYDLPVPGADWIRYLARAYCFADVPQRRILSALLFPFTWMEDLHPELRTYFYHAALEDTSETNLVGMMRCGGYELTESLIRGICGMICKGRNHYHALFAVSELLDLKKAEKIRLLARAREEIESFANRESWYAQHNPFVHGAGLHGTDAFPSDEEN